jgi:hypothetical protein
MGMVIIVLQDDAISEFTMTFILDHDAQFSKNLMGNFALMLYH